jgi:tRNA (adenine57-N1/adenine58-N1)-methyltransferase
MAHKMSPFLYPGPVATADALSIVHLKRDLQTPTILREHDEDDEGYSEGKVVNTRFGSFPHRTLIGLPWGSQVRASKVDTGSRGRRVKGQDKKRKREESEVDGHTNLPKLEEEGEADGEISTPTTTREEKEAVAASSGFIHLLPPTPENWTSSLPHRTQVVYTPDYSYILHRLRARPGTSIIEAGAGSGSFTHASARAVYSGYPEIGEVNGPLRKKRKLGKVWSFEFHEQRHEKLQKEIQGHGLEGIVQITHRDVCEDGFLVDGASPNAEAVFLDLPAPWLALPHLSRSPPPNSTNETPAPNGSVETPKPFISPLSRTAPIHMCTFSPCIEQVQRTVSTMRQLGWVDIEMVELSQKRFEIRRERIGIDNGAQRGLQSTPASVDEAVTRLLEVEGAFKSFHQDGSKVEGRIKGKENPNSREKIVESLVDKKIYKEGKLVHRTEPEVKTHTSYLVFAVLPMKWSDEDEAKARSQWEVLIRREDDNVEGEVVGMGRRQMKRAERQSKKDKAATTAGKIPEGGASASGKKVERRTSDTGANKGEVEHTNDVDPESMNTNE